MSKRSSTGQSNTLLNYFPSPKNPNKNVNLEKSDLQAEKDKEESDDELKSFNSKKRRVAVIRSDSDSENVESTASKNQGRREITGSKKRRTAPAESSSDSNSDGDNKNIKLKPRKRKFEGTIPEKLDVFGIHSTSKENISTTSTSWQGNSGSTSNMKGNWLHDHLSFLKPNNIRDINKNRSNHPDYDKNTLFVPDDFLKKQTPAMRQWWILKSQHFDSVLFFKVGKFYELYHMDAVIGVNHIALSYMKGEFAHSGFPETAYGKMASSLVEQGFKVARVEQTETPEMMAERCKTNKKPGKLDKVVTREICQITTTATCIYGAQLTDAKQPLPCYMFAIAEQTIPCGSKFGVCFIDTSIGVFHIGNFSDDKHCSRLLTLLTHHQAGLVLTERGCMQSSTSELLKKILGTVRRDTLASNTQFTSAQKTVDFLMKECYFQDKNNDFSWPPVLNDLIEDGIPKPEYELGLKALGACIWYLKDSKLDIQVLSMRKFKIYSPIDTITSNKPAEIHFMALDSTTMDHLSLLGGRGTLQNTLDYCQTAFGKRLLQRWICRPLCNTNEILERQAAVKSLYDDDVNRVAIRNVLKKLPDLERQVVKIHMFGNRFCATNHPDSRAVLYESKIYSKRKVLDLLNTLQGFKKVQLLVEEVFTNWESLYLKKLTQHPPQGKLPDISDDLEFFEEAFDQEQAQSEGKIIPQAGVDEEYDNAEQAIIDLNDKIQDYLKSQEQLFDCQIKYFGSDKKRYQLEIPEYKTENVKSNYQLEGIKKGTRPAKRYSTPETRKFLAEMIKAETKRNKILYDLNRRIYEKFSDRHEKWEQVTNCLMILDVLCAFAEYAKLQSRGVCFPTVLPFQDEPLVNIEGAIHPCTQLDDFVANDTVLGTNNSATIMLLTGPNMGGKSTLMRQVALIIIMTQMGCPVPASNCEISLVDRIFTRIGARDDILRGQSTFLVELSEAAAILQHATHNSFVLLDELGRGTSTHDGNAIATAYLKKLTDIKCRTIFSTHYHSLIEYYMGRDDIQLAHMACMTDKDEDDPTVSVTLLYQLKEGNCPKSYGFNAAQLAGLPKSIIKCAHEVANDFENRAKCRQYFHDLLLLADADAVRKLMQNLRIK